MCEARFALSSIAKPGAIAPTPASRQGRWFPLVGGNSVVPQMNDGQLTTHPEPDPAPFKVHLLTRAGRVMRARSEPLRAFSTKDEAVRFAGRQLGGHYAVYHKDRKIWPTP